MNSHSTAENFAQAELPRPQFKPSPQDKLAGERELLHKTAPYIKASIAKSVWQIANSFLPFFGLLYLMHLTIPISYWLTFGLGILASGFVTRIFIIQHDCGHGSFFRSKKANEITGFICSFFSLVPYAYWRRQHAIHHAGNGNLDRRGVGDMDVFTVKEYLELSKWDRFRYRIYRHPLAFLVFGPIFLHAYLNRFPKGDDVYSAADRRSVWMTNFFLLLMFGGLAWWLGAIKLLLIALPIFYISSGFGIWLFYIQHQFEHTYWKPNAEWSYVRAAMQGSSYYKLPKIMQWFTGNIGYHHIHHLKPLIPNYELEKCHEENPELRDVYELTLWSSLKTMFLSVWDEEQQRLISFRELKKLYMA